MLTGEKKKDLKDNDERMLLLTNALDDTTLTEAFQVDEPHSKKSEERGRARIDDITDKKEQGPIRSDVTQQKDLKLTETQNDDKKIDDGVLKQFFDEGQLTVRHTRCIIVGCGNAGKTTLLKRLQNVSYEELVETDRTEMVEETDRTEMVDFHVNCFEVLAEENTIQSKLCFLAFIFFNLLASDFFITFLHNFNKTCAHQF